MWQTIEPPDRDATHGTARCSCKLMIYVTKALFLLSVPVLSSSSGPPPVDDDTLSLLLCGHSITDEQLVRVSMEQMRQWTNYLSVSVTETLRRRRRQIKNRHYQAMCRRRKQQRGSSSFLSFHHESHVSEIVPPPSHGIAADHEIARSTTYPKS